MATTVEIAAGTDHRTQHARLAQRDLQAALVEDLLTGEEGGEGARLTDDEHHPT